MTVRFQSKNLIFLISQQRAGSTLLQRVLAGHPDVHTAAEPWLMLHPIYALRQNGHQAEYNADLAHKALRDFLGTLDGGEAHYVEALRRMALYLYGTACEQAGKARFLDKTPRYYYIIPELARIFPEAKFVFLLRNPLAVLSSILTTWVKGHWELLARYRDDLLLAPDRLAEGIKLFGDAAIVVRYEDLVTNASPQVQAICRRLGLDFLPAMIEYGQRPKPEGEMGDPTGIDRQTRPSAEHLDRWLEMGRDRQTRNFAEGYLQALGPDLLRTLGYDQAEMQTRLSAVPCTGGQQEISWRRLMEPDETLQKRLYYIELALLEHRRLAHRLRTWRKSWFSH